MNELEAVTLHAGAWTARVVPQMGMNTVSLTWQGRPVLREPDSWQALAADSCVYGTPILLPPNRTAGGRFCFDGRDYQLPINEQMFNNHLHGQVHCQRFTVTEVTDTLVSGVYENRGETFPFPYRMEVSCLLTEEGCMQEFVVTNTGGQEMPLAFGLHTVFVSRGEIRVPIGKRWVVNNCYIPTGELEELSAEAQAYLRGVCPDGRLVRGFYTASGSEARIGDFYYRVSANFDQWVLWNGDGTQGFCAIEPLQGAVNSLNSGEGLLRLKPGETERFATAIYRKDGKK